MTAPFEVKTSRAGVTQINVDALATALVPLTDPNIETAAHDGATRPAAANPTSGPHRYTIVVPNAGGNGENSIVNIGQAAANRINDTGITGRTKTHIHWHTTEAPTTTMVSLGGGTTEGVVGLDGVNHQATNKGFMVTTDANSFLDAKGQMYLVSRTSDVVVRAQSGGLRVIADQGALKSNVEVLATNDVYVGSKRNVFLLADPAGTLVPTEPVKKYTDAWPAYAAGAVAKPLITILDVAGTIQGICSSFESLDKIGEDGSWGFTSDFNGVAKLYTDVIKLLSTGVRYAHSKDAPGQVKINGDSYASLTGGIAASLYGGLSASITSVLSASVLGGTASLKGIAWASIWAGAGVSIKTMLGKAEMKSEKGKANITAKKDIAIASSDGKVKITSKTGVQLNATGGPASVHSDQRAYLGAGKGSGMGVVMTTDTLKLGAVSSADKFTSAAAKDEFHMKFGNNEILTQNSNSNVHLGTDALRIASNAVAVDGGSGNVTVKGSKILLG